MGSTTREDLHRVAAHVLGRRRGVDLRGQG